MQTSPKTMSEILDGLPSFTLVNRPARSLEEEADPTTIYGANSPAELAQQVSLKCQPVPEPKTHWK